MSASKVPLNCVIRVPAKDSYSTQGPSLMGRQSANEGFLTSWFRHSGLSEFWCMARFRDEAQVFARIGEGIHQTLSTKASYRWIAQNQMHRARSIGTVYLPGPQVADMAWVRRRDPLAKASDFSLVGMTHTSCELPIQDSLADMLTAPVYPWDAQICPSESVKTMVQRLLQDEADWLREHLGASRVQMPQLPVLPLGVDCDKFDPEPSQKALLRGYWRARWQIKDSDVCVLYLGRLDLRTKANLYPMFDALELAAQQLKAAKGPALTLVLAGWFASEWDESTIREALVQACPTVKVYIEDGRTPEARQGVWHGADIFTSLVDNIQETFGLTPLEAMAAGLPVVVSDYDGYRESVRDGVDGYRIATWQPPAGAGSDLIDRHADVMLNYRDYVSQASAYIGIDIAQASAAYVALAQNAEGRRQMGLQGQQRAREHYDWRKLIPRYISLFEDLGRVRRGAGALENWHAGSVTNPPNWGSRYPRRSDPYHSFSHYAKTTLHGGLMLRAGPLLPTSDEAQKVSLSQHFERPLYENVRASLNLEQMLWLLNRLRNTDSHVNLQSCWEDQSDATAQQWFKQVGWLIKTGLVTADSPGSS